MEILSRIVFECENGEYYYRIVNASGKEYLFNSSDLKTALQIYQPSALKGKVFKHFFPYLHFISFVRKMLGAKKIKASLLPEIKACLDLAINSDYDITYFGGTPCVHQKAVLQISKEKSIVAYCKISDSNDIAALFDMECENLNYLRECAVNTVPQVLLRRDVGGFKLFCQSSVKEKNAFSVNEFGKIHIDFLENLFAKTKKNIDFIKTDYYNMLCDLKMNIKALGDDDRAFFDKIIDSVIAFYQNETVEFSFYHGDFTPWNTVVNNNQLYAFDFEYAKKTYPPYLDAFHFFMQNEIFAKKVTQADEIINDFEMFKKVLEHLNIDSALYFKLYLLEIINLYLSRGENDEEEKKNMKLRLLTLRRLDQLYVNFE